MATAFERAIVILGGCNGGHGLDQLLSHVGSIDDILSLRAVSRAIRFSKQIQTRSFDTIYISTPSRREKNIKALPVIGPLCKHLIIKVAYPEDRKPSKRDDTACTGHVNTRTEKPLPLSRNDSLYEHQSQHSYCPASCSHLRQRSPSSLEVLPSSFSNSAPPVQPAAFKFILQRRPNDVDLELLQKWHRTLSLFTTINTLTISCNGDPGWPGCTDIEMLLISLRICIERINFKVLHTVRVAPIHAHGLLYLRWAGAAAFGEARAMSLPWGGKGADGRACIWQRIQCLELWIRSPYSERRLSESQKTTFEKSLVDYLQSFKRTIEVLKLGWVDGGSGPNPLFMGDAQDERIWERLREVWLGNVVVEEGDVAAMRARSPLLEKVMVLVGVPRSSGGIGGYKGRHHHHLVWRNILQVNHNGSERSSITDSSRYIPIRLDI